MSFLRHGFYSQFDFHFTCSGRTEITHVYHIRNVFEACSSKIHKLFKQIVKTWMIIDDSLRAEELVR